MCRDTRRSEYQLQSRKDDEEPTASPPVFNDCPPGVKRRLCLSCRTARITWDWRRSSSERRNCVQAGCQAGRCLGDNAGLSHRLKEGDNTCGPQSKNPFAVGMGRRRRLACRRRRRHRLRNAGVPSWNLRDSRNVQS